MNVAFHGIEVNLVSNFRCCTCLVEANVEALFLYAHQPFYDYQIISEKEREAVRSMSRDLYSMDFCYDFPMPKQRS